MTLAAKLRAERMKRGLTQPDVAFELGVAFETVSRWELGKLGFHPAMAEKVQAWIEKR